jgi:hypothetical protein
MSTPLYNSKLANESVSASQKANGRIRNWNGAKSSIKSRTKGEYNETNHGRYSRRCSYNRYSYTPRYTSFITERDGILTYEFGFVGEMNLVKKPVPAGMRFSTDALGAKLVRVSDGLDYHFTGDHFLHKQFALNARLALAKKYRKNVEENKQKRIAKKSAAQATILEKLFQRDLKHTYVNLNDSRAVGNCVEGSLRFAETRLKIGRDEILRGGHLCVVNAKRLVDTKDERAIRAARRAWARETLVTI